MRPADSLADLAGANDIAAARRRLTALFDRAGIDSPALDARVLIQHALSLDHTALAAAPQRTLSERERDAIAGLAARRLAGEPVARILGVKEFWGLTLSLSAATLVPRPETETVVESALAVLGNRRDEPLRIADLGTGTGAILLALLHELRKATGVGTDLDATAIETARANAQALGLLSRAQFVRTDFGSGLDRPFDLVVSNPPYIATGEIVRLAPEVRDHDPMLALDGGSDGLDAYRALAAQMPSLLNAGGAAIVEIGIGQAAQVDAIFKQAGLHLTGAKADLAGIARALTFMRR
jgi:release factor glutamine methyltransferase